jgi:hypothetical protein
LSEVDVDGLVLRYLLIELIRVFDRAVLYTGRASRAFVLQNVPGSSNQGYPKVSCFSFYTVNVSIRQDLYVWMPADLDQFGCKYSYGAVVGGKGLVKLGHMAAYGRCLVNQVYLETRSGKVKRGLNSADPSADNHHISEIPAFETLTNIVCETFANLGFTVRQFFVHFSLSLSSE